MGKKRKTRQEKIILQLKRELAKKTKTTASTSTKSKPSQEAISKQPRIEPKPNVVYKKPDDSILFYDPKLVGKDLLKTFILTVITLGLEFVLYLKLR